MASKRTLDDVVMLTMSRAEGAILLGLLSKLRKDTVQMPLVVAEVLDEQIGRLWLQVTYQPPSQDKRSPHPI